MRRVGSWLMHQDAEYACRTLRVRVIAFALSAVVVTGALTMAVLTRAPVQLGPAPAIVQMEIVTLPRERERTTRPQSAPRVTDADVDTNVISASQPYDGAAERGRLARALRCFSMRGRREPVTDCPRLTEEELAAAEGAFPTLNNEPPEGRSRAEQNVQAFVGVTPPCGAGGANWTFCARPRAGVRPSRSAQQICEDGGIGPCGAPPIRAEADATAQEETH